MSTNKQLSLSQQKPLPQTKETQLKTYQKRLKDDIKSMVDNYVAIVQQGKVCGVYHVNFECFSCIKNSTIITD